MRDDGSGDCVVLILLLTRLIGSGINTYLVDGAFVSDLKGSVNQSINHPVY